MPTKSPERIAEDQRTDRLLSLWETKYTRSQGYACPCRLLGKRHQWGSCTLGIVDTHRHWVDHFDLWLKDGKPHVWTSQPYAILKEDLFDIMRFCGTWGFDVCIGELDAWWNSGCTLISVRAPRDHD